MAEGKRYYWLKLHDDFFSSKRIKKLRKMAGGDTYTIIYLKMQLLALKRDGVLTWSGLEDSFPDELALDIDEEPDNVRVTLAFLMKYGLAETSDNINFFLPYVVANTGSEGASAARVREFRDRQKLLQSNAGVTDVKQITNGEKEIEKEKEIELEKEQEKPKNTKHKYGDYKNVLLTDEELEKLKERFPTDWNERIQRLDSGIELKGYKYKSHYLAILKWSEKDAPKTEKTEKRASPTAADINYMTSVLNKIKGGK